MISKRPDLKFSWGYEPGTVKAVLNCDHKLVYSSNMDASPYTQAKSVKNSKIGAQTWELVVTDTTITFKDDASAAINDWPRCLRPDSPYSNS